MAKLIPKHELFCQEYVKHGNGMRAYEAVYGLIKQIDSAAARIHTRPEVLARIAELHAETAERNKVTVDSLVAEYNEIIELAKSADLKGKGYAAVVNAINSKAKITGNWVDQVQVTTSNMSDAEIAEAIKGEGSVIPWAEVLEKSRGK